MSKSIGRNDPSPCGSGKKYKRCCGDTKAPRPKKQTWDELAVELSKLALELDVAKAETSIARLVQCAKLQGLEYYATVLQHHGEPDLALQQLEKIDPSWIPAADHWIRL